MNLPMLGLTIILGLENFLDIVTTNVTIHGGRGGEANPVQQFFMNLLGGWWWLSKLILVPAVWAIWYAPAPFNYGLMGLLVLVYAYIVFNNWRIGH